MSALPAKGIKHWSDYPMGVVAILAGGGPQDSRLQPEHLERCAAGFGAVKLGGAGGGDGAGGSVARRARVIPGPVLARLCQRAENEFVGANCGIMDQFISVNGKENHALLLDCRDLSFKLAPIPGHVALVIANTMVKHSVAGGDYPTRRRESEAACAVIAGHRPGVPFLRDATLDDLGSGAARWSPRA